MKHLLLLLAFPLLTSCGAIRDAARAEVLMFWDGAAKPQLEAYVATRLAEKQPELLALIDKNKDNRVSLDEVKGVDFKDPQNWMLLLTIIGGFLGLKKVQKDQDELWDATHAPTNPPAG